MAFIPKKTDIGRTVRVTKEFSTLGGKFTVGHELKVIDEGPRGHDLQDADGNRALEMGMSRNCYEFASVLDEQAALQAKLLGIENGQV